jgi:hypothetical protein
MNDVVETWFKMRDAMLQGKEGVQAPALRPPSLRYCCYAVLVSQGTFKPGTSTEIIESYVNGLELGALDALRRAWERTRQ